MVVLFVTSLAAGFMSGLVGSAMTFYSAYLVGVFCCIAIVRIIVMRKLKTNWDVSERPKRVRLLLVLLGVFFLFLWSMTLWHNSALTSFALELLVWNIGFFFLTLKIKLSGHVGIMTLATGIFLRWFGFFALPLVLCVPLVAWSRLALKRHTSREVLAGALYSIVVLMVFRTIPG